MNHHIQEASGRVHSAEWESFAGSVARHLTQYLEVLEQARAAALQEEFSEAELEPWITAIQQQETALIELQRQQLALMQRGTKAGEPRVITEALRRTLQEVQQLIQKAQTALAETTAAFESRRDACRALLEHIHRGQNVLRRYGSETGTSGHFWDEQV